MNSRPLASSLRSSDLLARVDSFNYNLDLYYSIGPWGGSEKLHIDSLRLNHVQLAGHLEEVYESVVLNDSIEGLYCRDILFYEALRQFKRILFDPELAKLSNDSISKLLPVCMVSPDNRLINYCMEEAHGGTYHSIISAIQYRAPDGNFITYLDETFEFEESPKTAEFNADGYGACDTLNTSTGTVYHLSGGVKGCSTCFGLYHDFVRFEGDSMIYLDGLELSFRMMGADSRWDQSERTLTLEYMQDDLNQDFQCGNGFPEPMDHHDAYNDSLLNVCIFKFNGQELELLSVGQKVNDWEDY